MSGLKPDLLTVGVFKVKGREVLCQLDRHHHPLVTIEGKIYHSVLKLLRAFPEIEENVGAVARLVNFLCSNNEYTFIEDIAKFQEEYVDRVEFEQNSFDYIPDRIIDHGVFNITVMHSPKVVDNQLIFYVKNENSQLPYRVSCAYPIQSESPEVRYQLLPYAS